MVTLTVTEKGYCHIPSSGALDLDHPDIVHDLANPETPRSVPGLLARALEKRMASHGRPVTLLSCDNIPANGVILGNVVRALATRRGNGLSDWIAANVAFPSAMVDRIAPATTQADLDTVEQRFGYRDAAVAVGEPFRQWVIEQKFAGRVPRWDLVGATFVDDVTPFEHLKMRVLNGAQTTLATLGVLAGLEHTSDAIADPLLATFVRRMLTEETLPTLMPVPGISPLAYVEQSLDRLRNTAIRHRNHQIATDGSQKIVQRLLNPIRDRLRQGGSIALLVGARRRLDGLSDPGLGKVRQNAGRCPIPMPARSRRSPTRPATTHRRWLQAYSPLIRFSIPALPRTATFRKAVTSALDGLLSADPLAFVRRMSGTSRQSTVEATGTIGIVRMQGGIMKLGLLTAPFAETPLGEVADWASSAGFEALEIACWPKSSGDSRRYAGTCHIDAASTSASQAKEIAAALAEKKLSISALGYYPNPLHPDAAIARRSSTI